MPRKRRTIPWLGEREGVYYVFWTDEATGKTKRISLRTTDRMEAQQSYAAFLAKGHAIFDQSAGLTVRAALAYYKTEHVERSTIDPRRAGYAIQYLTEFFGDRPLKDIDIPASRAYADARRSGLLGGGAGVRKIKAEGSDATIRRELGVLSAAAHHALEWKRITADELPSIERPQEAGSEAPWLTRAELKTALDRCEDEHLKAFMMIAYHTAGRRHSVECLHTSQVDLKQSTINLRSPDESPLQRKSKKRRPVVPLFPEIRPTVERLMMANEPGYLFGTPADISKRYTRFMERIGFGHKGYPHVLRHSRATHLLQDGVSIYDVARLLGDTVATVERVYGHHSPAHLANNLANYATGL